MDFFYLKCNRLLETVINIFYPKCEVILEAFMDIFCMHCYLKCEGLFEAVTDKFTCGVSDVMQNHRHSFKLNSLFSSSSLYFSRLFW